MEHRKRALPKWILNVDEKDSGSCSSRKLEKLKTHGVQRQENKPKTCASKVVKSPVFSPLKESKNCDIKSNVNTYHSLSEESEDSNYGPVETNRREKLKTHGVQRQEKKPKTCVSKVVKNPVSSPLKESENCDTKSNVNTYHSLSEESEDSNYGPVETGNAREEKDDKETTKFRTENNTTESPEEEEEEPKERDSCIYGGKCYRRDSSHRKTYAHPGDSEYVSPAEEMDKPECEYGLKCYRKNFKHRSEFKHTRKPQPKRYAKVKAKQNKLINDDLDSGEESEDPFLVEFSSDEYVPSDD